MPKKVCQVDTIVKCATCTTAAQQGALGHEHRNRRRRAGIGCCRGVPKQRRRQTLDTSAPKRTPEQPDRLTYGPNHCDHPNRILPQNQGRHAPGGGGAASSSTTAASGSARAHTNNTNHNAYAQDLDDYHEWMADPKGGVDFYAWKAARDASHGDAVTGGRGGGGGGGGGAGRFLPLPGPGP